jgi:hypothetical protein
LLGHKSVKITEKHYAPWVKARQEQLAVNVRKRDYALYTRLIVLYYSEYGYCFGDDFLPGFVWPFTCLFTAFAISG